MRVMAALLCISVLTTGVASATCPTTQWSIYGEVVNSAEPAGQASRDCQEYACYASATVSWSAPLGWVGVSCSAGGSHGGANGSVTTTDDFVLLGAPVGSAVRVTATLSIAGSSFHDMFYSWSVGHALSDMLGRSGTPGTNASGGSALLLEVDFEPGVAQRLSYQVSASAWKASVSGSASLSFPDLPAGMSIVSCRGYQAGAVTATRPTSWGRLKQIYR